MFMTTDTGGEAAAAAAIDTSALTGGDAGAGAAGSGAAGAGAGGAAAAGEGGAGEGSAAWFAGLSDAAPDYKTLSDRAWAENKKYQDVSAVVKAMRGLESQVGSEKLPLPKGPDDADGWNRFYKAAGRPDAADGYKFDAFQNLDPALTGAFAPAAHGMGLSQAQAEGVVKFNEAMVAAQVKDTATRHAGEVRDLRSELGTGFDATLEMSMRAAERFGLDPAMLEQVRGSIGPKALIGMLGKIGKAMGEDTMAGGGRRDMQMTAEKAGARKAEIMNDKEFQGRLNKKEPTAVAEWAAINAAEAAAAEKHL
jgi:hypothetical protein